MIAKLEFTLPEEDQAHQLALHAPGLAGVIEEFARWLRGQRKYEKLGKGEMAFADKAWERLWAEVRNHGVEDLV